MTLRFATLFLLAILCLPAVVRAEPLGEPVLISGGGCRFPDAAYNPARGEHLVVWADYTAGARGVFGRRLTSDGKTAGEIFRVSPLAEQEAFFPAVVHCAAADEYLVTFDTSTGIQGQRVRGDGALAGQTFAISTTPGIRSAIAWSAQSNCGLVVYYFPGRGGAEVFASRVGPRGELLGAEQNLSRDDNYSGYPSVAHAAEGDQFLVTWDHEPRENRGVIRGRRLAAAGGEPLGEAFNIAGSGTESRSSIAYDSRKKRWLVAYNSARTKGNSYDQFGRFVAADGTLGEELPIATTADFEGDTLFGGDLAFAAGPGEAEGRFFSSFARDGDSTGMAGQELSADGKPIAGQTALGLGPYTCLSNAADTRASRFLTVWEGLAGKVHFIHGRIFASR